MRIRKLILRLFGVANVCFLIAIGALLIVQLPGFANDPGVGWHLQSGELVMSTQMLPKTDPFLASPSPRHWVSDQWLSDVLLAETLKMGDWPLSYALIITAYISTFLLLLYLWLVSLSGLFIPSALAALYAFKISEVHFIFRPVVFSFFFFTCLYLIVESLWREFQKQGLTDALLGKLQRSSPLLLGLFFLWANMHPSFFIGLMVLAIFIGSIVLSAWIRSCDKRSQLKFLFWLAVIFAATLLVTFLNPYGLQLHESILFLGQSKFFMSFHEEWKSPTLKDYDGQLFAGALAVMVLSYIISKRLRRKLGLFDAVLVLVFALMAIDAVRMLPYFAIASSYFLTLSIASIAVHVPRLLPLKIFSKLRRRLLKLERMEHQTISSRMLVIPCLMLVVFAAVFLGRIPFFSDTFGPTKDKFPYKALSYLTGTACAKEFCIVASHPNWGGFITHWGWPRVKPVIDDRNTLIGEDFYQSYFEKLKTMPETKELLKHLNATHVLISPESGLTKRLNADSDFQVLFQDEQSVVFRFMDDTHS